MTLDPKALEAAYEAYNDRLPFGLRNGTQSAIDLRSALSDAVAAYLAALPSPNGSGEQVSEASNAADKFLTDFERGYRAAIAADPTLAASMEGPRPHKWIRSNLGHGEQMCEYCRGTNRELAVLGELDHCSKAPAPALPEAKTVYVVMSNDFPDSVYADEQKADDYCKQRMDEQKDPKFRAKMGWTESFGPRIYYRAYPFEVKP